MDKIDENQYIYRIIKEQVDSIKGLACICDCLEEYDLAINFYSKPSTFIRNNIDRSMSINNIGITLANQQQYQNNALHYFQQSLSLRLELLQTNHSDFRNFS